MTTIYSDNFDLDPVGSTPSGWQNTYTNVAVIKTSSPFSTPNWFATPAAGNGFGMIRNGASPSTGGCVQYSSVALTNGTNDFAIIPVISFSGTATPIQYEPLIHWSQNTLFLYKYGSNSANGILAQVTIPAFANGAGFTLKFQYDPSTATAPTIYVKLWVYGTAEPAAWNITFNDTGALGLGPAPASGSQYLYYTINGNGPGGSLGIAGIDDYYEGTVGTTFLANPITIIAPSVSGITYSPYNWYTTATQSISNTCGAYAYVPFSGTSLGLVTNQSNATTRIRFSVDNSVATDVILPSGTITTQIATSFPAGNHLAVIYYCAQSSNSTDKWGSAGVQPPESLNITNFTIDQGSSIGTTTLKPKRAILYGDSIVQGYANSGLADDAVYNWVPGVFAGLNAEGGAVGFGGQGWSSASGTVPAFSSSYSYYFSGQSRLVGGVLFPAPDYLICEHGVNGSYVAADITAQIVNFRTIAPSAKIIIMAPFGGQNASLISTAVTNYKSTHLLDTQVYFVDVSSITKPGLTGSTGTGMFTSWDGLHPKPTASNILSGALTSGIQQALNTANSLRPKGSRSPSKGGH